LGALFADDEFAALYPTIGQPAASPSRLAMVTVLQYMENLTDRQAADAVRSRIDWKYSLDLELTDPGFHYSVLSEFRQRLLEHEQETILLDTALIQKESYFAYLVGWVSSPPNTLLARCNEGINEFWWLQSSVRHGKHRRYRQRDKRAA
jgi:hypothetical protein